MSTVALSQTLKTITNLKIRELQKQRKAYDTHKNFVLDHAKSAGDDERLRVYRLLGGVEKMGSVPTSLVNLSNIRSWLDQSKFDASIPDTMLCDFEKQLRSQLDVQTRKLDLASLYSSLLTEWLTKSNDDPQDTTIPDDNSLDGSFELVEKDRLNQLKEKFESVVFTPLETDEGEIDNYLSTLFEGDKGEKALERLRNNTKNKGNHLLKQKAPFNEDSLRWCLKGLLGNDLLSDDKKVILQDFLKDEVARGEICDVLNMKYADLGNWEWDAEENGMPVEPRRQLNGKYRIMMDEDVLQAIFLHYIGMMWSVSLKSSLGELLKYTELWKHDKHIPRDEADRRLYFLGENCAWGSESVARERQEVYRQDFFMSQLPSSVYEGAGGYDDDDDDDDVDERDSDKKSSKEVKQLLLRQLATETHLHLALNGKVAVVQSDMQWFGTSLPHSSICAVLRFIGMPEGWVRFFKKFLEAPLNMGPVSDDPAANRVRIRLRGTPMAHALEKFFGELVLFFMDLAVNQEAEMLLYRFHDDLWLCGEPRKCSKAWIAMKQCATVMGLEFNSSKTGSVHITRGKVEKDNDLTLPEGPVSFGFLILDSRDGEWIIDQQEVDKHVKQLKKQLSHCNSILSWVQTWNSCIGRFFSHTFGEPANCFGKSHVDRILETYKRMQDEIFDGSNITTYLKALIAERFGVTDVPDAFVFMPEELGGLGVRNPFIPLFLVRDQVFKDPASLLTKFLKEQEEGYKAAAKEFEELDDKERARRLRKIYVDDYDTSSFGEEIFDKKFESNKPSNLTTSTAFMTFDEFRKWDESVSISLARTYRSLMDEAMKKHIVISRRVKDALADMDILLSDMDGERKWLLMLYEKELFEKCGGLSIVRKDLLPLGILTILRQKRVSWQMVL